MKTILTFGIIGFALAKYGFQLSTGKALGAAVLFAGAADYIVESKPLPTAGAVNVPILAGSPQSPQSNLPGQDIPQ